MNPILPLLARSTADCHRRLEQRLPLFEPGFSRVDYIRLLQAFLGFHKPLESALQQTETLQSLVPDLPNRIKAHWLEADLRALGMTDGEVHALPVCGHLPELADSASALGCLYVLEGATLGGKLIAQHVRATLQIETDSGARFFAGYGGQTGAMWRAFGTFVSGLWREELCEDRIVLAARSTFLCFEGWLEGRGLLKEATA